MALPACTTRSATTAGEQVDLAQPAVAAEHVGDSADRARRPPRHGERSPRPFDAARCATRRLVSTITTEPAARSIDDAEVAGAAQLGRIRARHANAASNAKQEAARAVGSSQRSLLERIRDPARLRLAQQRAPGRHRRAWDTVENDVSELLAIPRRADPSAVSGLPSPPFSVRPWHEPQSCRTRSVELRGIGDLVGQRARRSASAERRRARPAPPRRSAHDPALSTRGASAATRPMMKRIGLASNAAAGGRRQLDQRRARFAARARVVP